MLSRYVHIRSLQCVKITCKFTERFLINQCFCHGTFFLAVPCIIYIMLWDTLVFSTYRFKLINDNFVVSIISDSY